MSRDIFRRRASGDNFWIYEAAAVGFLSYIVFDSVTVSDLKLMRAPLRAA